ncbi:MAG: hypothetical protein JNL36_02765 [Candidatus Kapabacteria bacterium]|nr:hypothetical protein [Candidatus Kapabacteria bacterium]
MFANSIIAQSQNQKIGSSTVANPNAAVTSDSDCGCGGSSYQGLIASSQKLGDCGCGGHEEDNQPQGLMRFGPAYTGASGTLIDCFTVAEWERTETIDMPTGGNSQPVINISYQFKGYTQDCYTWNLGGGTNPIDVTTGNSDPIDGKTPNCPTCLKLKEFYKQIEQRIKNPFASILPDAKVLLDFLIDSFKTMLQSIIDKYSDTVNSLYPNDPDKDDIINEINKALIQGLDSKFFKNNLIRYLDFITSGITDEDVKNENFSKCKSMIQPFLNWNTPDLYFLDFNNLDNNPFGGKDYLEENPTFYPSYDHQRYLYSDVAIALEKKHPDDRRCQGDKYKVFEYKNGKWNKK